MFHRAATFAIFIACFLVSTVLSAEHSERSDNLDLFSSDENTLFNWHSQLKSEAKGLKFSYGRLIRVARAGKVSYVLGTIHSRDVRLTNFSVKVEQALRGSRLLVLEMLENDYTKRNYIKELLELLIASNDRRPASLLEKRDFDIFLSLYGSCALGGINFSLLKPFVISLVADHNCRFKEERNEASIEEKLVESAQARNIPTFGIETLPEQIEAGDNLPVEVDRDLMIAVINRAKFSRELQETEIKLYLNSQSGLYLTWVKADEPIPGVRGTKFPPEIINKVITERNYRLTSRIIPFLDAGDAFIALGINHIPGDEGIANLLVKQGFDIEVVE